MQGYVSTRFQVEGHCVLLAVQDEGAGISPEHCARLCDPFFTTKHVSGGTGFGLAITSTLVRAHGGSLPFESTPGQGTCARVTLPRLGATPPLQGAPPPCETACHVSS